MALRLVDPDEANLNRVYIAGPLADACGYNKAADVLTREGFTVANDDEEEGSLRVALAQLLTCDAICLLEDWWTSTDAHYLQTVAAWLRLTHLDPKTGKEIPTVSLKGVRR